MRKFGLGMRLNVGGSLGPTAGQIEAAAWATAAGAGATTVGQNAIAAFINAITGTSLTGKLRRVNLLCGSDLAAVRTPLPSYKAGATTDTATGLLLADYAEATGLKGNATDKYLDTGFASNVLGATDRSLAVWETERSAIDYAISLGTSEGVNVDNWWIGTDEFATQTRYRQSATFGGADATGQAGAGCYIGTSNGAGSVKLFTDGGAAVTAAVTDLTPSTTTLKVLAAGRPAGAASNPTNARVGAYVIGTALTDAEANLLYSGLAAAMSALGRP